MEELYIPTAAPLVASPVVFLRTSECTHCDVLAVTITPRARLDAPPPAAAATFLPAAAGGVVDLFAQGGLGAGDGRGGVFGDQKDAALRAGRHAQLHAEHRAFFAGLAQQKRQTSLQEAKAATGIQAAYRGYRQRLQVAGLEDPRRRDRAARRGFDRVVADVQRALYLAGQPPLPGHPAHGRRGAAGRRPRRFRPLEHAMAARIQAAVRMFLAARRVRSLVVRRQERRRLTAALTIQCAWRGMLDRRGFLRLALQQKTKAATLVQQVFRGTRVRYRLQLTLQLAARERERERRQGAPAAPGGGGSLEFLRANLPGGGGI
mmetsp:Transcript_38424/g.66697  ORF Transcript_38424/g.66697 Transcript_38424/m.66697 type:complete len:319 (+) Transcript_38424:416-1372(+)